MTAKTLVEQLRNYSPPDRTDDELRQASQDIHDAADEIERLQNRLEAVEHIAGAAVAGAADETSPVRYSLDDALRYLDERAAWIEREIRNGGNWEYLRLKLEECQYVAQSIRDTRARIDSTAAEPPAGDYVPVPQNERQAELMEKMGYVWLKEHAPHRLRPHVGIEFWELVAAANDGGRQGRKSGRIHHEHIGDYSGRTVSGSESAQPLLVMFHFQCAIL